MNLVLGFFSLFSQKQPHFLEKMSFNCFTLEKLTKTILFDYFDVKFDPHSRKKPNFKMTKKAGKIGQTLTQFCYF